MGADDGPDIPGYVVGWAAEHAEHRRRGDEQAADDLRERIAGAGFSLVESEDGVVVVPAQRYALTEPRDVPDHRQDPSVVDVSVLLLLQPQNADSGAVEAAQPSTAARARGQDDLVATASRCLAAVLATQGSTSIEVVICDDGVGGAAADWAADAVRSTGIRALHLPRSVGTAQARALQHRTAMGSILLWLEPDVELVGDVFGDLRQAFSDPAVGMVRLDEEVDDVLALRRALVADGTVGDLDPAAPGRSVAAAITAAGSQVVVADLDVVRHT